MSVSTLREYAQSKSKTQVNIWQTYLHVLKYNVPNVVAQFDAC